jgi:hypothetical protein
MNTDKNGWPYLVIIFAIFACIGGLIASTENIAIRWFGCIAFLWFWSCVGLFLNLAFSEQLKSVPLYKKLFFAFFPLMYMSPPWRDWFHQELNARK